jgi:hypothetical protein
MGYADDEIKRFDIDWQKGSSATILLKGLGSGAPIIAYADIKAGFGLDKVSSFIAVCAEFTSKGAADAETIEALRRVKEHDAALEAAARKAVEAVDRANVGSGVSDFNSQVSKSSPSPSSRPKRK